MGSYWIFLHQGWSKNQELLMTDRLLAVEEAPSLCLVSHVVTAEGVVPKACEIATEFADKPSAAWRRTKVQFREIALAGFDEAFSAGVFGQQEAYAKSEL